MLVLFSDPYVIVPLSYVKFCKYASVFYCGDGRWYERNRVVVSDRQFVRPPIVLHWSSFAILFLKEEKGGYEVSLVGFRLFDVFFLLHFVDPFS